MKNITKQLADALREASRALTELDPLADQHDAKLLDQALAAYDAQAKPVRDMTDDELLAELAKPAKRYTVEFIGNGEDMNSVTWGVEDHKEFRAIYFGPGFEGKRRAIAVARALNDLEG